MLGTRQMLPFEFLKHFLEIFHGTFSTVINDPTAVFIKAKYRSVPRVIQNGPQGHAKGWKAPVKYIKVHNGRMQSSGEWADKRYVLPAQCAQ